MTMKHLLALLLACAMLAGCSADSTADAASPLPAETEVPVSAAEPVGLYDAGSALEAKTDGAVRAYPLNIPHTYGMAAMGEDLLIFSGMDATTLTKLSGDELHVSAVLSLDFWLSAEDASLRVSSSGLSYYDPIQKQTVVLDTSLKEISHIAAPEDLTGTPVLSADKDTLYYCTANTVRAWDLDTGIRRVVKEMAFSCQSVTGLHLNDTVLQCQVSDDTADRIQLISAETGRLLWEGDALTMSSSGDSYYISFPTGITQALLFGQGDAEPQALTPADITASCVFLEQQHAAVTVSVVSDREIRLDCYDLESGCRRCALPIDTEYSPLAIQDTAEGWVYVLIYDAAYGCETVYRWNTVAPGLALNENNVYTGAYYTAAEPDYHGLVRCQSKSAQLGSRYGVEILLWDDTAQVQPWDYDFEAEYLVPVLERELALLETRLSNYPDGFLEATASNFSSLKICLVRKITGSAESGSLDSADGIQYFDGTDAYIALAIGDTAEKALYHELYHVMETQIFNESIALDQWDKLNPVGFAYDYDYIANTQRDGSAYLAADTRSFVDTYSMSFPKEDRARIMEYAMTAGNEALFAASPLQYKLKTLCQGIREAYGLEKSSETFLWEQYLVQSLAYTG